jgi:hypothetical protein
MRRWSSKSHLLMHFVAMFFALNSIQALAANQVSIFSKPVVLRGNLGNDQVEMQLRPKLDEPDSVEGSYIVFNGKRNHGNKIVVAGEVSGTKVTMEESEDGVDVCGQWDGALHGTNFRGVWQSDDGKTKLDFNLEISKMKMPKTKHKVRPGNKLH